MAALDRRDSGGFAENYKRLSPREAEVCELIRDGKSSKEIAGVLNVSVQTVSKHRFTIRRKLEIANKNINLSTYLRSK
jgi:DNA-binding NarL/FixJ family response regulator